MIPIIIGILAVAALSILGTLLVQRVMRPRRGPPGTHSDDPPLTVEDLRHASNVLQLRPPARRPHLLEDLIVAVRDVQAQREAEPTYYEPEDYRCARFAAADAAEKCVTCGEGRQDLDPGFSAGRCCFCGYWGVPPGPEREAMRAERRAQAKEG